jgi:hypothetical protein
MIVVERHMSNISDILWREQLVALSYLDKDTLFLLVFAASPLRTQHLGIRATLVCAESG